MTQPTLTAFQDRLVQTLRKAPNQQGDTATLAAWLKSSPGAVASSGRALERAGIVCSFLHGSPGWELRYWALCSDYREAPISALDVPTPIGS